MSSKSRQREHTERPNVMATQIDPHGHLVQVIRTPIPELHKIYARKRDVVGNATPAGVIMYINNPHREGESKPFTKIVDVFGSFSTETLEESQTPAWFPPDVNAKPKSGIVLG